MLSGAAGNVFPVRSEIIFKVNRETEGQERQRDRRERGTVLHGEKLLNIPKIL